MQKTHRDFKRFVIHACVLASLAVLSIFITNCSSKKARPLSKLPMNWRAIDSLNAQLPAGIRVFAGQNDSLPLRAWYAVIDEPDPAIETRIVMSDDAGDNRETATSFARDLGACVVVNGGYFTMHKTPAGHMGLLEIDGKIIEPANRSVQRDTLRFQTTRAAIGFTDADEMDIAWVTSRNDTLFAWKNPPENHPGKPAAALDYRNAQPWFMRDAIGVGPALIMDGKIRVTSDEEVFFGTTIPLVHPRTAAGYTADGRLILLVVDGRQQASRGVSLRELATLMDELGCVEALNLDGGGSSTIVVKGVRLNRPAGKAVEREVMSALAVFCE